MFLTCFSKYSIASPFFFIAESSISKTSSRPLTNFSLICFSFSDNVGSPTLYINSFFCSSHLILTPANGGIKEYLTLILFASGNCFGFLLKILNLGNSLFFLEFLCFSLFVFFFVFFFAMKIYRLI